MRQVSTQILSAASNANQTGAAQNTAQWVSASFQVVGSNGDEAGTLKMQASNDGVNWSDITNATSTVSAGAGPMIVIANMCFVQVRAVYTKSSGGAANKLITVQANGLSI